MEDRPAFDNRQPVKPELQLQDSDLVERDLHPYHWPWVET